MDREEDVGRIVGSMTDPKSNVNYALVGHRRIGKSTILLEAKRRLERQGGVVVGYVDLGEFRRSPVDLAESLARDLTRAYSGTLSRASRLLGSIDSALSQMGEIRRLRARFTASIDDSGRPRIEIDPYVRNRNENPAKALTDVFEYANGLSRASKRRVIIMIDEFQHVVDYRRAGVDDILGVFKTVLERRADVSFLVSGSRIHYLRDVLGRGGSPLFGHFVMLDIGQLEKRHALELFVRSGRARTTRADAEEAYRMVGGHPYYLVMLAEGRMRGESVTDAYVRLLASHTGALYLYVNYVLAEDLGSGYKSSRYPSILTSIARGEKSVSEISRDAAVRMTDLPRLLKTLIEYDLVGKSGTKYHVTDRVVGDFLVRMDEIGS